MSKARKPTRLLELSGAFQKNPSRAAARLGDATPTGELCPPVENLSPLENACWLRIVAIAAPGVLKNSDEAMVELTARLWAQVKQGTALATEKALLRTCLLELGMTPAARSRVSIADEDQPNIYRDC